VRDEIAKKKRPWNSREGDADELQRRKPSTKKLGEKPKIKSPGQDVHWRSHTIMNAIKARTYAYAGGRKEGGGLRLSPKPRSGSRTGRNGPQEKGRKMGGEMKTTRLNSTPSTKRILTRTDVNNQIQKKIRDNKIVLTYHAVRRGAGLTTAVETNISTSRGKTWRGTFQEQTNRDTPGTERTNSRGALIAEQNRVRQLHVQTKRTGGGTSYPRREKSNLFFPI